MIKPRYEHDCDHCTFLGIMGRYDIYTCPQGGFPTIVARHGTEGEYLSGASLLLHDLNIELVLQK